MALRPKGSGTGPAELDMGGGPEQAGRAQGRVLDEVYYAEITGSGNKRGRKFADE